MATKQNTGHASEAIATASEPRDQLAALNAELVEALRGLDMHNMLHCMADVLNPCWNDRPSDILGKHWGGGKSCAGCFARALLAKVRG